jgi:general secretion pathway protein B
MSFILDALRKSEIERKRQSGPSVAQFPVGREDRRLPVALVAIAVLLAVNVAVVLYFVLRDARQPATVARQVAGEAPASVTAPAAAASRAGAEPFGEPSAAGESPLASEVLTPDEYAELPTEIYGAPATLPPDAPDPTLLPDAPVTGPGVTYSEAPAENSLAAQAATGLPELTVDLHIFMDDPTKRAVFINGRRYTQGARIAEGPRVEEITREGAVLSWRGRRFLLPRL